MEFKEKESELVQALGILARVVPENLTGKVDEK